jgi:hypothetical protein
MENDLICRNVLGLAMSKHETPMTRWYWQQVGGTLIEEFVAAQGSACGFGTKGEIRWEFWVR